MALQVGDGPHDALPISELPYLHRVDGTRDVRSCVNGQCCNAGRGSAAPQTTLLVGPDVAHDVEGSGGPQVHSHGEFMAVKHRDPWSSSEEHFGRSRVALVRVDEAVEHLLHRPRVAALPLGDPLAPRNRRAECRDRRGPRPALSEVSADARSPAKARGR